MTLIRVAVLGAGVNGVATAYRLGTEIENVKVTVVADQFSPNLTSDGSAGLWDPYGADQKQLIWSLETYKYLMKLALDPEARKAGVSTMPLISISHTPLKSDELPDYSSHVMNFRQLTSDELEKYRPLHVDGFMFQTAICEPIHYIPWLTRKLVAGGCQFITQKVTSISKILGDYDLVVNCTGLGARELVPDANVLPISGQVIKVKTSAPVNKAHVLIRGGSSDGMYVIPGRDWVTLGGTYNVGDSKTDIRADVRARILKSCSAVEPALQGAETVYEWCGLRPYRNGGTRLEVDSSFHLTKKVIHNYGHGGIGVSLHWGCAGEVVDLVKKELSTNSHILSKL